MKLAKEFDLERFFQPEPTPNKADDGERNVYLVLRYRTNFKKPLKENYQLAAKLAEIFHEGVYHEELEDGFLLFYQKEEDFVKSRLDKTNPVTLKDWLEKKG
ncbi:MAG: hypothetical protein ACTSU5_11365 [Promethearchaeota archaeon]